MSFKFKTEVINSFFGKCFLGKCLVITDTTTSKNIEVMKAQADLILRKYKENKSGGSFPHGGYDIDGEIVTIYHDLDRENHEIEIDIRDLLDILIDGKGTVNTGKFIDYSGL